MGSIETFTNVGSVSQKVGRAIVVETAILLDNNNASEYAALLSALMLKHKSLSPKEKRMIDALIGFLHTVERDLSYGSG